MERVYTAWMHAVMSWGLIGLLLALAAGLAAPRGWLGLGGGLLAAGLLWIGLRQHTIGFESVLVTQHVGIQLTTHFRRCVHAFASRAAQRRGRRPSRGLSTRTASPRTLTPTRRSWGLCSGAERTRFIEWTSVKRLFINEVKPSCTRLPG